MGRIGNNRRLAGVAALILLSLVLTSCENLGLFLEDIDDAVKTANDRYLEVLSVSPVQNDRDISPSIPILVTFDRSVDPEIIDQYVEISTQNYLLETTVFKDEAGNLIDYHFNAVDRTLAIYPKPYLEGGVKVIISLKSGLPAEDGTILRDTESWSYYTGKTPAGSLSLADGTGDALDGYTASPTVGISVETNSRVDKVYITDDPDDPILDDHNDPAWIDLENSGTIPANFTFTGGDGEKTLYARFFGLVNDEDVYSPVVSDSTIFDATPPNLDPYFYSTEYTNRSATVRTKYGDVTSGMNLGSFQWTSLTVPSEGSVEFSAPTQTSTSVTVLDGKVPAPMEQWIELQVSAMDRAGNTATETLSSLYWDAYAAAPTVESMPNLSDRPDTDLLLRLSDSFPGYTPEAGLNPVSEYYLEENFGTGWLRDLVSRAYIPDDNPKDIGEPTASDELPFNDLGFYELRVNNYSLAKTFVKYAYDEEGDEWWFPDIEKSDTFFEFRIASVYEVLSSGYYDFGVRMTDELANRSEWGTSGFTYLSTRFEENLAAAAKEPGAGRAFPDKDSKVVNRAPSFAWPLPETIAELEKVAVGSLSTVLFIRSNDDRFTETVKSITGEDYWMLDIDDVRENFWLHTGPYDPDDNPDGLPDLGADSSVSWWYEFRDSADPGKAVFSSLESIGDYYHFNSGRY